MIYYTELYLLTSTFKKFYLCKNKNMSDTVICPKCSSEFTYPSDNMMVCSQCFYEWDPAEAAAEAANEGKIPIPTEMNFRMVIL